MDKRQGPYRTPASLPQKVEERGKNTWYLRLVNSLRNLTKHQCEVTGVCEFQEGESVAGTYRGHDVLYFDRPLAGSRGDSFYWGMMLPCYVSCQHCKRPFRVGDPLPEGASFDHWEWSRHHRKRPDYVSEERWAELQSSGYFDR